MDKVLGQDLKEGLERTNFLRDNCEAIEDIGYTKQFTPEKMEEMKNSLVDNNISLRDVRADKKASDKIYNDQIKQLEGEGEELTKSLKEKAEFVNEACYKFVYEEERMTAYYNSDGIMVFSRPSTPEEMQKTIQMELRRTGTEG